MSQQLLLNLPWPPSVNVYYRHIAVKGKPRTLISARGRIYRRDVAAAVGYVARIAEPKRVGLKVVFYPPDARRRDIDNPLKALLDALTHAGVWDDDSQVRYLSVGIGDIKRGGEAAVTINIIGEEPT